ncbi:MAG: endonuclease Q family protein [Acutalibacter sp.]
MFYADLHIHSRYSRATSRDCDLPHLELWARKKGIALVGTGDFTHPAWRQELQEQLLPAEEGLYRLKEAYRLPWDSAWPQGEPRFLVTGEISSIYKQGGKTRKVHNVLLLPSLEAAEKLARRLERIGNLQADGRPILGLSSHDLLELTLESCPQAVFLPAHIWTPHFSLFGAFSGFDSLEECFGDLAPCVRAVETGLSSDPPMNGRVPQLDALQLVSHSDAHSPQKLGREADVLETELSYPAVKRALETGDGLWGTVEFFPQEGKYHWDGHRNCGVCLSPREAKALGNRCPVCGKPLTIGVEHRVEDLARRQPGEGPAGAKPFVRLAPLATVLAARLGKGEQTKTVQGVYEALLAQLGPEFTVLRQTPAEAIAGLAGEAAAQGVELLRQGKVAWRPGFDGEYGKLSFPGA